MAVDRRGCVARDLVCSGLWTAEQKKAAQAVIAQIAGIPILIIPRLLNYIVAIYLILIGLAGLFGVFGDSRG